MKRKRYRSKHHNPGTNPGSRPSTGRSRLTPWLIVAAGVVLVVVGVVVMRSRPNATDRLASPDASRPAPPAASASSGAPEVPGKERALIEGINRANQLLAKDQPEEAASLLREIEKVHPNDEDVHYNLGITLARLGKNEEAEAQYREALRIFPDYAEAHNNLGNLLLRIGKLADAEQHFEQAVKVNPEYASAWNNYGTAMQQAGKTNEAALYYEKAARLDTNYWQARFNLARSYIQQGRTTDARHELQAVLQLQPGFPPAQTALDRLNAPGPPVPLRP